MAPCLYLTQTTNLVANEKKKMSTCDDSEDLLEDLFEEDLEDLYDDEERSVPHKSAENAYFLLDLKLPDPKTDIQAEPVQDSSSCSPKKYGFLELLEKIHNKDLTSNNPWLNPALTANKRHWRTRYAKQVRFSTTEITTATLPHCRRNGNFGRISGGKLHAATCSNAAQETAEVLGEHVWHNRVFILETCVRRPTSQAEFYNPLQASDTEEDGGYCKPEGDENGAVFDSVELRKRQLSQESTTDETSSPHIDETSNQHVDETSSPHVDETSNPHVDGTMFSSTAAPDHSDDDSLTSSSTVKLDNVSLDNVSLENHTPPTSLDRDATPHTSMDRDSAIDDATPHTSMDRDATPHTSMDRDSAIGDDHGFDMFEPPRFQIPSDSDYGSDGVSESEILSDTEEDSDVDLTSLLEKISAPSAPAHQMWFKTPHGTNSSSRGTGTNSSDVTNDVTSDVPCSSTQHYRTPWPSKHIAGDSLRGTLNINNRSVIGELLSPESHNGSHSGSHNGSNRGSHIQHMTHGHVAGLHTPSPDDVVKEKQSAVFKQPR